MSWSERLKSSGCFAMAGPRFEIVADLPEGTYLGGAALSGGRVFVCAHDDDTRSVVFDSKTREVRGGQA